MTAAATITYPPAVSRDEWLAARKQLLLKEKAATKANDALAAERRKLPMVEVDKAYTFEGPAPRTDKHTLADLFEGRRQLVVYHFMFDPDHELPCNGCSFAVDNVPHLAHLHARDTSFALISRAPVAKLEPFRKRMGWTVPWYSSFGSDFNYDFHVTIDEDRGSTEWNYRTSRELKDAGKIPYTKGELPGISVFLRDDDRVFHTYSSYARGLEPLVTTLHLLDLTPFGRGEGWGGMPDLGQGMDWVRFHDEYENAPKSNGCCH